MALFNQTFNWKSIWESSNEITYSNKEKQFQWKIIHNAIFTEYKFQLMNFSVVFCDFCKIEIEDIRHLFCTCPISLEIVKVFQDKINRILNNCSNHDVILDTHHVILGYTNSNRVLRNSVNFSLQIMKWELWKIRNKI